MSNVSSSTGSIILRPPRSAGRRSAHRPEVPPLVQKGCSRTVRVVCNRLTVKYSLVLTLRSKPILSSNSSGRFSRP